MFLKLSFRTFLIGFLVLSILWVTVDFLLVARSIVFPPPDIHQIVRALELQSEVSAGVQSAVEEIISQVGPLQRAIPVGYYTGVSATLHHNDSHVERTTQVSYIAWFQKARAPMLFLITRSEKDGTVSGYELAQGAPMSLVGSYALPLGMLAFSLVLFKVSRLPRFKDWHE